MKKEPNETPQHNKTCKKLVSPGPPTCRHRRSPGQGAGVQSGAGGFQRPELSLPSLSSSHSKSDQVV